MRADHPTADEPTEPTADHRPEKNGRHPDATSRAENSRQSQLKTQINILVIFAVIAFLYFARTVILPILLAAVAAMALKPVMKLFSRWHIPKFLGAVIILVALLGVLLAGFVELSIPAMKWLDNAPQHMAELKQRLDKFKAGQKFTDATDALGQNSPANQQPRPALINRSNVTAKVAQPSNTNAAPAAPFLGSDQLAQTEADQAAQAEKDKTNSAPVFDLKKTASSGQAINWTAGMLGGCIETAILFFMFLALGEQFLDQVIDGTGSRKRALTISSEIQHTISRYLFTVSAINFILGVCVGTALFFLKVPNAPLWGLLAAVLNYVIYFGPIVGIAIVGIVGVVSNDNLVMGLLPAGIYLVFHITEADFITPILLGRQFTMSPIVIFVFLLFAVLIWGVIGALLAVPVLISIKIFCQRVPSLAPVCRFF